MTAQSEVRKWIISQRKNGLEKAVMNYGATYRELEGREYFIAVDYKDYEKLKKEFNNLKTLLGECEKALDQALRQWDMYASNSQENLEESDDMEAIVYRDGVAILQKIKAARGGK